MTIEVNQTVLDNTPTSSKSGAYTAAIPKLASSSNLSDADSALWTNRTPQHEPWARGLTGNTPGANSPNAESGFNTSHEPQFTDDGGGIGSRSINRIEGMETIPRNQYWRR